MLRRAEEREDEVVPAPAGDACSLKAVRRQPASGEHVFLFSSRRRHTRSTRDWSSDVCSSELRAWMAEGFSRLGLLVNRSSAVWAIAAAVMASSANAKNTRLIVPVPFDTPRHLARAPRRGNPRTWRMSLPENRYPPDRFLGPAFGRSMRQSFDRACLCAKERGA